MKLVASAGGKDGNYDELPAAETCALEDGEEEEQFDAVHFKEERGNKFFNKLKGKSSKKVRHSVCLSVCVSGRKQFLGFDRYGFFSWVSCLASVHGLFPWFKLFLNFQL